MYKNQVWIDKGKGKTLSFQKAHNRPSLRPQNREGFLKYYTKVYVIKNKTDNAVTLIKNYYKTLDQWFPTSVSQNF